MKTFVCYINVGNLPKAKADDYIEKIKTDFEAQKQYDERWFFVGVREGDRPTGIELVDDGRY